MKIELGLRAGVAIPIISILLIGMGILLVFNYFTQVNILKEEEKRSIETAVNTTQALLQKATANYLQMSALVARLPEVQELVSKKDRNRLIDRFLPAFTYLKEEHGLAQFQFHLPPAVSLVRLHELTLYGDDLSTFRGTIMQTYMTKKPTTGLEAGVGGIGLRAVEPIIYKGTYVGSVEFGGGLAQELKAIKQAIIGDVGVIVHKESLAEWVGLKDVRYKFGDWIPVASTLQDLRGYVNENAIKRASQSKEKYYKEDITIGDKEYSVVYTPLKDFSGKNIGFIYIVKEKILSQLEIFRILGINVLAYIVMLVVMAFLIGYGMNKFVINPIIALTKAADEISMGKTSQKIEITNARGEIAVLVKAIERMRITMKKLLE
ncbi:cache domain-containing protein [Thermodesulfovibrio sp.]|jgi:methyl-accepting chemotaxis protein|uniref:cache domain-containing protein n=1 Tax=Thermodesulfovibrio sp. TaxID=2067987 RepID=UPI0030A9E33F